MTPELLDMEPPLSATYHPRPDDTQRYFLREPGGKERYLHMSGQTFAVTKAYRWIGSMRQAKAIMLRSRIARKLVAVKVPQPKPESEVWK